MYGVLNRLRLKSRKQRKARDGETNSPEIMAVVGAVESPAVAAADNAVTDGAPVQQVPELYCTEGAIGIEVLAEPPGAVLDIVFVHGLTGNRVNTWTHAASGLFWPESLAEDIQDTRIMTWGYDADPVRLWSMVGGNNVRNHAKNMASDISDRRRDCRNRPVIFITHSLGGLVCAQALLICKEGDRKLERLVQATRGIIFMGTPHAGGNLAQVGHRLAALLNIVRRSNPALLEPLRRDSSILTTIQQQFQQFLLKPEVKIEVYCFFEERDVVGIGIIVPEHSATLSQYPNQSIAANHMDMTKFSSKNDQGYQRVLSRVQDIIETMESSSPTTDNKDQNIPQQRDWYQIEQESKCLQVLRGQRDYEGNKNRNAKRVHKTCRWILEDRKFIDWRDSTSAGLLWISADPGIGKSVLARSLIDEKLLGSPEVTTCYFFFREDDESARSPTDALCSLLHQLLVKHPALFKYALPHAKDGVFLAQLIHTLWDILLDIVDDSASPALVFVIDALDESEDSGNAIIEKLVNFYTQYQTHKRSLRVTLPKLKFLVTSRPYFDIQKAFGNLARGEHSIHLSNDNKNGILKAEIELVIDAELSLIKDTLRLQNKVTKLLRSSLLEMDNRNYLWLHLVFDVIKKSIGATTWTGMQKLIEQLPKTADEAYEAILRKSSDPEEATKLLQIVVAAIRPLTVPEMRIAMGIDENTRSRQDLVPESIQNFEITIRNQCGLFVTIMDQKVYLVHNTAKDFLLSTYNSPVSATPNVNTCKRWKNSIDLVKSHEILAWACIRYLRFSEFEDILLESNDRASVWDVESDEENSPSNLQAHDLEDDEPCKSIDSMTVYDPRHWDDIVRKRRFRRYQFLEYSSMHWLSHFEMASPSKKMCEESLRLCEVDSYTCANWFDTLPSQEKRDLRRFNQDIQVAKGGDLAFCSFIGHTRGTKRLLRTMTKNVQIGSQEAVIRTILAAISFAVQRGRGKIVQILVSAPVKNIINMTLPGYYKTDAMAQDIDDFKDVTDLTALRLAVQSAQHDIVRQLLEMKADPNAVGRTTILMDALCSTRSEKALMETVRLLLQYGAEVNGTGHGGDGNSPLHRAEALGLPESICRLLRDAGGVVLRGRLEYGIMLGGMGVGLETAIRPSFPSNIFLLE